MTNRRHVLQWLAAAPALSACGASDLPDPIAAWRDLSGAWRGLRGLGKRPLAEALFTDPLVARRTLEYVRIDSRHPLGRRARRLFGRDFPPLWARRSRFVKRGRPLLVTEVFLPALGDLR